MRIFSVTINKLNRKIHSEYREPVWNWGFRAAISITVPLIFGVLTGRIDEAFWMAIAAECIMFIELNGDAGIRIRALLSAVFLSVVFCFLGSWLGNFLWFSILGALAVGFISGMFKNLGERGAALALSVYLPFVFTIAFPLYDLHELLMRSFWVLIGGAWSAGLSLLGTLFIKEGTPYRRTIFGIWKSIAELTTVAANGWNGKSKFASVRDIYLCEKKVREALDESLNFFDDWEDRNVPGSEVHNLAQVRKTAAIFSLRILQLNELLYVMQQIRTNNAETRKLFLLIHSIFITIAKLSERMSIYVITLRPEEEVLVSSQIERLRKIAKYFTEQNLKFNTVEQSDAVRIANLCISIANLAAHAITLLSQTKEKRVFKTYSFVKTTSILHPKHFLKNIRQILFNKDSLTTRYALRVGAAAMVGTILDHWFFNNHGYWITFTAIIVSQPYFGATLKRGIQRSLGTIFGIVVGSVFLLLPYADVIMLSLVFFSSIFLIFYLRKQYSIATFFITLMLVGLLNLEKDFDIDLMLLRVIYTVIGSFLAIAMGFLLFPARDKNLLPKYIAQAIVANYNYFQKTFYPNYEPAYNWTKFKRIAETKNMNAYDSYTRFLYERAKVKKKLEDEYFNTITHNVKITRALNVINSEKEHIDTAENQDEWGVYKGKLLLCRELLMQNITIISRYTDSSVLIDNVAENSTLSPQALNENQKMNIETLVIELRIIHQHLMQLKTNL